MDESDDYWPDEVAAVVKAASLLTALVDRSTKPGNHRRLDGLQPDTTVALAARTVPGARFADLLAWRGGKLVSIAASAGYPPQLDAIRVATEQGPRYEALNKTTPVISQDVRDDARWPAFGPRTLDATAVQSIASWQVQLPDTETGALSCYSDWPYGFSELAVATGSILANCCSLSALRAVGAA